MRLEHLLSGEAVFLTQLGRSASEGWVSLGTPPSRTDGRRMSEGLRRYFPSVLSLLRSCCEVKIREKGDAEVASLSGQAAQSSLPPVASPIAQLVRAPH